MGHERWLRQCWDVERLRVPDLQGRITMAWVIATDGSVASASIAQSTIGNENMERCVLDVVKSWKFPPVDGPVHVAAYPFNFGFR